METEKPSYYAVIPANVRYDKELNPNAKLLYGEITCLANKKGYCYASNTFFAELYGVDKTTISKWISQLKDKGYITVVVIKNKDNQIVERQIRVGCENADTPIGENADTPIGENANTPIGENANTPIGENANTPIGENAKENTTRGDYYEENNIGASAPTSEKAPKPARKAPKKPALLDREPQNDMERVEKSYLENYMSLKKQGLMKTDMPVINWGQSRKLLKDCLGKYGLETIMDAVRKSVENDFCIQKGYSLTTILSSGVLTGLINGNDWHKGHAIDSVDHPIDMGEVLF